jgi:hypothetical protein
LAVAVGEAEEQGLLGEDGVRAESSLARAGTFIPMMGICFSTSSGSN